MPHWVVKRPLCFLLALVLALPAHGAWNPLRCRSTYVLLGIAALIGAGGLLYMRIDDGHKGQTLTGSGPPTRVVDPKEVNKPFFDGNEASFNLEMPDRKAPVVAMFRKNRLQRMISKL